MVNIDDNLTPQDLLPRLKMLWDLAADKLLSIHELCTPEYGTPVFTVNGRYQAQGWTEWTQGFQFGSCILQYDATNDDRFLEIGREQTLGRMASHLSHTGVHDHGFNNISTYGNLRRLMLEGRIPQDPRELDCYELALKVSGAVQAARWSETSDGDGYIYSFNGPHSLFCDTIRSLRSLALAHQLGHVLSGENDVRISLLDRLVQHACTTAKYSVYYGENRDTYDVRGRVAHESIFNVNDGNYRCPSTQQGYSPFTTWTRGLAWIVTGYPELLEFLTTRASIEPESFGWRESVRSMMIRTARTAADYYLESSPTDGIPYWDTGAPGLAHLGEYQNRPSDPFNDFEPVDSSAAAIAAQGLVRLGLFLLHEDESSPEGRRFFQGGLTVLRSLLDEPYLSTTPEHQGLLLHSVYHRPRGWDHIPDGSKIPRGESCMWGDYHLLELALLVQRIARQLPYLSFFGPVDSNASTSNGLSR